MGVSERDGEESTPEEEISLFCRERENGFVHELAIQQGGRIGGRRRKRVEESVPPLRRWWK